MRLGVVCLLMLVLCAAFYQPPVATQSSDPIPPVDLDFAFRAQAIDGWANGIGAAFEYANRWAAERNVEKRLRDLESRYASSITAGQGMLVEIRKYDQINGDEAGDTRYDVKLSFGKSIRDIHDRYVRNDSASFGPLYTGYSLDDLESYTIWYSRDPNGRITTRRGMYIEFRQDRMKAYQAMYADFAEQQARVKANEAARNSGSASSNGSDGRGGRTDYPPGSKTPSGVTMPDPPEPPAKRSPEPKPKERGLPPQPDVKASPRP